MSCIIACFIHNEVHVYRIKCVDRFFVTHYDLQQHSYMLISFFEIDARIIFFWLLKKPRIYRF